MQTALVFEPETIHISLEASQSGSSSGTLKMQPIVVVIADHTAGMSQWYGAHRSLMTAKPVERDQDSHAYSQYATFRWNALRRFAMRDGSERRVRMHQDAQKKNFKRAASSNHGGIWGPPNSAPETCARHRGAQAELVRYCGRAASASSRPLSPLESH